MYQYPVFYKYHLNTQSSITDRQLFATHSSRVSCQKGPTRHADTWQIGPFWLDTLELGVTYCQEHMGPLFY